MTRRRFVLCGYRHATWSGISGDNFPGRFVGADFAMVDNTWLDEHVRSHGPLGAQYPKSEYVMEGDSPSFLYLVDNGLGNPEPPDWGSWGGRYEFAQFRVVPVQGTGNLMLSSARTGRPLEIHNAGQEQAVQVFLTARSTPGGPARRHSSGTMETRTRA